MGRPLSIASNWPWQTPLEEKGIRSNFNEKKIEDLEKMSVNGVKINTD